MRVDSPTILRVLAALPDNYQTANNRADKSWQKARSTPFTELKRKHRLDLLLADPRCASTKRLQLLIMAAKVLEELGETSAEMSSTIERLTSKTIASDDRFGLMQIFAAAVGRGAYLAMKIGVSSTLKLTGAALYGSSALVSAIAICTNGGGITEHQYNNLKPLLADGTTQPFSATRLLGNQLSRVRNRAISNLLSRIQAQDTHYHQQWPVLQEKLIRLRRAEDKDYKLPILRASHLGYMTENIHQYGPITRALHHAGFAAFKVVNKTLTPIERILGQQVAHTTKGLLGFALSNRITLGVAAMSAGLIDLYLLPAGISFTLVGLIACGVAAALLIMAKASAAAGGWRGDLRPT